MAYWAGFDISALMKPLVAFNVYRGATITSPTLLQPFPFTTVDVNEGGGWNTTSFKFTAPLSGIYVLSYTTASKGLMQAIYKLVVNGSMFQMEASIFDTNHSGIDMTTRCVLLTINQGIPIWITGLGTQAYGSEYELASFKGFLLSPINGIMIAWSAVQNTWLTVTWASLVNVGYPVAPWNNTLGKAVIPIRGIYFVTMTTIASASTAAYVGMRVNGLMSPFVYTRVSVGLTNSYLTRSSSSLAQCNTGDTLDIQLLFGLVESELSFSGFLVYPQ